MGSCNCISRNYQNESTLNIEKYRELGKIVSYKKIRKQNKNKFHNNEINNQNAKHIPRD